MDKRITLYLVILALIVGASVQHWYCREMVKEAYAVIHLGRDAVKVKNVLLDRITNVDDYIRQQAVQQTSNMLESLLRGEVSEQLKARCKQEVRRARKGRE